VLNLLNELIFPNLDTDVVENITTPIQKRYPDGPTIFFQFSSYILLMYRVIINYCPIAVGVENPHKFGMCR
jgi:hypothetical protein